MVTTFNKIILIGYLSRDPELRGTATGTAMATFAQHSPQAAALLVTLPNARARVF